MKVIALLAFLLIGSSAAAQDWTHLPALVSPSVLRLEAEAPHSGTSQCSAVTINQEKGYVVSSAHCIAAAESITVDRKHATIVKSNRLLDLVVLSVPKLKSKTLVVRTSPAGVGSPVAVVGFALGSKTAKYQFGWVSDPDETTIVNGPLLDAAAFPGDSGGAIVDYGGRLITITRGYVASDSVPVAFGFGVPPAEFYEFVEEYLPAIDLATLGVAVDGAGRWLSTARCEAGDCRVADPPELNIGDVIEWRVLRPPVLCPDDKPSRRHER